MNNHDDDELLAEEPDEMDTPLAQLGFQVLSLSASLVGVIYLHGRFLMQGGGQWLVVRHWVTWILEGIAIVGLVCALIGWMQSPYAHSRIRYHEANDSRFIRMFCAGFGLILFVSAAVILVNAPGPMNPGRAISAAVLVAWGGFIFFLSTFYVPSRHRAVTTFLNVFTPIFAFALVPLVWPLLVGMSIYQPDGDACDSSSGSQSGIDESEEWEMKGARE